MLANDKSRLAQGGGQRPGPNLEGQAKGSGYDKGQGAQVLQYSCLQHHIRKHVGLEDLAEEAKDGIPKGNQSPEDQVDKLRIWIAQPCTLATQ